MYTLVAVSGLLSPSAFVRLPEMRISVLHKGHSILFHLLDFISVFAPQKPVLAAVRLHFACGGTALAGYRPRLLGLPRKIARGISLRETTLCGCPLRGHGFATPHRYFAVPVTAAPRRGPNGKTPALAPIRSHFTPRNRAAGYRPHLLGLPRKIGRGISLRETTLGGRPLRGHGFAAPHRPFPLPAAAAPTTA